MNAILSRFCDWVTQQEALILAHGDPLPECWIQAAKLVGVTRPERVRVGLVGDFPVYPEPEMRELTEMFAISSDFRICGGKCFGYGIILNRWFSRNVLVLLHELTHTMQCERSGGIASFSQIHLAALRQFGYKDAPFEVEARQVAGRLKAQATKLVLAAGQCSFRELAVPLQAA